MIVAIRSSKPRPEATWKMTIPTSSLIFMLLIFALFFIGGIAMVFASCRSDRFIIVTNPWRRLLMEFADEATLRTVDKIVALVVGCTLCCFGLMMMILLGVVYYFGLLFLVSGLLAMDHT